MVTFETISGLTDNERYLFKKSFKGDWPLDECTIEGHTVGGVVLPTIRNGVVER